MQSLLSINHEEASLGLVSGRSYFVAHSFNFSFINSGLRHQNVVLLLAICNDDSDMFIVTECMDRGTKTREQQEREPRVSQSVGLVSDWLVHSFSHLQFTIHYSKFIH